MFPERLVELLRLLCPLCGASDLKHGRRIRNTHEYRCLACKREFFLLLDGPSIQLGVMRPKEDFQP